MHNAKTLMRIRRKVEHATLLAEKKATYNMFRANDLDACGDGQPIAGWIDAETPILVGQCSDCYPASIGMDTATLVLPNTEAVIATADDAAFFANSFVDSVAENIDSLRRMQAIRAQQEAFRTPMARNVADSTTKAMHQTAMRPEQRIHAVLNELFPNSKGHA